MDLLYVALMSLFSILVLFLLTKIMGNKQMSQLSMFDYINGITIGSIAAEMATSLENDFLKPLVAMVVYAAAVVAITFITQKSVKGRRLITGRSIILLNNGKINKKNFSRAQLDLNEFLTQCRVNGYFDISKIQTAIIEPNGKLSILPKVTERPLTPSDMNLPIKQEKLVYNIILDGNVMYENLKSSGNNMDWLEKELKLQGEKDIKDIFLATCDSNNKLTVFKDCTEEKKRDFFQ